MTSRLVGRSAADARDAGGAGSSAASATKPMTGLGKACPPALALGAASSAAPASRISDAAATWVRTRRDAAMEGGGAMGFMGVRAGEGEQGGRSGRTRSSSGKPGC